jgi:hypothetical protein
MQLQRHRAVTEHALLSDRFNHWLSPCARQAIGL